MQTGTPVPQATNADPAETALRESEVRLALATRAAQMGVWDWDLRTQRIVLSDRAREIYGLPQPTGPVTLSALLEQTHPDDRERTEAQTRRALDPAVREHSPYEYRIVRPDGEVRWVLAHGQVVFAAEDGAEQAVRYVGTLQDVTANHRLQEALVESEHRLRLAIDGARLAVWEMDLAADTLVRSPELNRLLGFAADANPSMEEIRARYPPGERERISQLVDAAIARGERFLEVEYRYRWPSGETRWLMLRGELRHDEHGPTTRAVGVLIDLTDRRRAEEALRLSEARLRLVQEAGNVGVWDWDLANEKVTWSPEMYAMFGLDPEADQADPYAAWVRVLHPEDREAAQARAQEGRRHGWSDWNEFRICRGDTGEVRWIRSYGTLLEDGQGTPVRVIGVNVDVTDLHRQQELLENRNRTLREVADRNRRERARVFEMSQDLIASGGFDGYFKVVNPAWGRVLGYAEADLLGTPYLDLVHPADRAMACGAIEALRHGRHAPRVEVRMRRADGHWRWIAWQGSAEDGVVYAVGRDVTQQKEAAEELEEANRKLRTQIAEREQVELTLRQMQRLEAVGQLTSGVAHDFNNLLTVILGNIDVLEARTTDGGLHQRLGLMRQAAVRGATLTAQLLAFSRRQRLESKPIDLNDTVRGMSELLRSTMGGSVRLKTECEEGLWHALADPTQIELVILNLAINARDAMPVGGSLTLRTANVTLARAPESPGEPGPGQYVVITVCDTGAGMPPEVKARAFEPFFTTKEIGKGSGLGLPQVLGFAQQSGGGVRIESAPGMGTCVSVYLPRAHPDDLAGAAGDGLPAGTEAEANPQCVLLVDDDEAVREVTATKLRDMGLEVIEAGSGRQALDVLARTPGIDLLVADFAMPGMNGAELARRARGLRPTLPVLFVTGFADQSVLAAGHERVVQKPFRGEELQRQVRALLARPREG